MSENLEKCLTLLNDPEIRNIAEEYDKNKKAETKLGFNLFRLISDTYYKENLHSAILAAFLNKDERHGYGDLFLKKFIEFLNSLPDNIKITVDEYSDASVFCEKGKIDIQIRDKVSGKVIIIENKINNAVDQKEQLFRYVNEVERIAYKGDQKYKVDCIVYLLPTRTKSPNMARWDSDKKKKVEDLLKPIAAYNPNEEKTLNSWIEDCKEELQKPLNSEDHARFVLIQYQELLKQLAGQIMDTELMEQFYDKMIINNNLSTALNLKELLEHLVQYRIEKLINTFKHKDNCDPFKIWEEPWKKVVVVFEGPPIKDFRFKVHVVVQDSRYKFQIWPVKNSITLENLSEFLELEKEFERVSDSMLNLDVLQRVFEFPGEEQKLVDYINHLKEKLRIDIGQQSV